jgi:hypothetical protein
MRTAAKNQLALPTETASVSGSLPSVKSLDFSQTGRRCESIRFRSGGIFRPGREDRRQRRYIVYLYERTGLTASPHFPSAQRYQRGSPAKMHA